MVSRQNSKLEGIEGLFNPRAPLLDEIIPSRLLKIVAAGISTENKKSLATIVQKDGKYYPPFIGSGNDFCDALKSTDEGMRRCKQCDCEAIKKFVLGKKGDIGDDHLDKVCEFKGVVCYKCYAGLLEIIRPINLKLSSRDKIVIGLIWAGKVKVTGHCLNSQGIYDLSKKIGYSNPEHLFELYEQISRVAQKSGEGAIHKISSSLKEVGDDLEKSATELYLRRQERIFANAGIGVAETISDIAGKAKTADTTQKKKLLYSGLSGALKNLCKDIGDCESVLCRPLVGHNQTTSILADSIGVKNRELHPNNDSVREYIEKTRKSKGTFLVEKQDEGQFIAKLSRTLHTEVYEKAIIKALYTRKEQLLWITFLQAKSQALTPTHGINDSAMEMLNNLSENFCHLIDIIDLLDEQENNVKYLEQQKNELLQNGERIKLLINNMAHQVSRPIMELKQSSLILSSMGFKKRALDIFRASLAEVERGARNFAIYEKLSESRYGKDTEITSFDMMDLIEEANTRINPYLKIGRWCLDIEKVQKNQKLPRLQGDWEDFLECIVNIFHNAIKYSIGSRPVNVRINRTSGSGYIDIYVTNHGIDIPEDEQQKIFEAAYRASTSKALTVEGSGIGLYVCKKLMQHYGGDVSLHSCVPSKPTDSGQNRWETTFQITFPLGV